MEVDKETVPSYINIVFDDNTKYLDKLREQAESDGQCDDEKGEKKLSIRDEGHKVLGSEIYFENGELFVSCDLTSKEGDAYICLQVPLSQGILFDILGEAIKKFNKIKTVLEATK